MPSATCGAYGPLIASNWFGPTGRNLLPIIHASDRVQSGAPSHFPWKYPCIHPPTQITFSGYEKLLHRYPSCASPANSAGASAVAAIKRRSLVFIVVFQSCPSVQRVVKLNPVVPRATASLHARRNKVFLPQFVKNQLAAHVLRRLLGIEQARP